MGLELPASLPPHDPDRWATTDGGTDCGDPTNGERAHWGYVWVTSRNLTSTIKQEELADAIGNILHWSHEKGMDPLEIIRSAVENFLAEASELP